MNLYVVVEGQTEKAVYSRWIPTINPTLECVEHPSLVQDNQFCVISGMGYPMYWDVLSAAIDDINDYRSFDRLIACLDSHDMTVEDKLSEVEYQLTRRTCIAEVLVVIQHFCFETWALGNRVLVKPHPNSQRLRDFKAIHDVRRHDPELLPPHPTNGWPRSQFAEAYLKAAFNERGWNLTYSKGSARYIGHPSYLNQLTLRNRQTGHIPSFSRFLEAFS
jgi:hypothetical protein